MKLLNKYVLHEWIVAFITTIIATCGILLLQEIYNNFQDLIICGASSHKIFSYFYRTIISVLPSIIPISLFISILFSIGKFNNNNEIIAMRASGLNIWQIVNPIIISSILLTILCFILNTSASPKSFEKNRRYLKNIKLEHKANIQSTDDVYLSYNNTFLNQQDNRIWFISQINSKTNEYFDVNIYQNNADNVEVYRISAQLATYDNKFSTWTFINGKETKYEPHTKLSIFSKTFESKIVYNFNETPNLIYIFNKKKSDLSFNDLKRIIKYSKNKNKASKYFVDYYNTIAISFSCILIAVTAIPLAIRRTRTNPMIGITRAITVLFLFYIISHIFSSLGSNGQINYILAAWGPNIILATLAIKLYKRAQ